MSNTYKRLEDLYFEQHGDYASYCDIDKPMWELYQVDYRQVSTKDLLRLLTSWNISASRFPSDIDLSVDVNELNDIGKSIIETEKRFHKIKDAIKTELATREHIPNKSEAKKIRQEKARKKD